MFAQTEGPHIPGYTGHTHGVLDHDENDDNFGGKKSQIPGKYILVMKLTTNTFMFKKFQLEPYSC